jgi:O-antigen ligase
LNALLSLLIIGAIFAIHILAGGRSLAHSLPSYGVLGVAGIFSWWQMRHLEIPRRAAPALVASIVLFGYVIARTFLSPDEYLARKDLYLVLAALTVYLLVALNLTSAALRARLTLALLVLAAAHVAVGAIQFARGNEFSLFASLPRPDYGTRASGFFGYPNHLAAFLGLLVPLGLGIAFWSRWRPWAKIAAGSCAAVALAGIVLSGSRGGFVSVSAGLCVFGILSTIVIAMRRQKPPIILLAAVAIVAVLLATGVHWVVQESVALHERASFAPDAIAPRVMLWRVALKQFQLHPIFGAGSGSYLYFAREFKPLGIQADPEYAHNDHLQFLAEYGAVGAVGFLLFLAVHVRCAWRALRLPASQRSQPQYWGGDSLALNIGALSATAACLVHASVDFTLHSPAVTLIVAFVFGILANPGGEWTEPDRRPKLGSGFRVLLPVVGVWILLVAILKLPAEICAERSRLILSGWEYRESQEVARSAAEFARRGIAYDSRNPELYYCLGEALVAQAATTSDPEEKARLNSEAERSFRSGLAFAPRDSRLLLCRATALDALQRFDEAQAVYIEAIRRDPISKYAHWAYGRHFELQHKSDEAEAAYLHSLRLGGGVTAQLALDRIAELRKTKPQPPTQLDEPGKPKQP